MKQAQHAPVDEMKIDVVVKIPDTIFVNNDGSFVFGKVKTSPDAQDRLLTEVDFKWLMAGQGWWINIDSFHFDPSYAAETLRSALASPCDALRACAATLQSQLGREDSGCTVGRS